MGRPPDRTGSGIKKKAPRHVRGASFFLTKDISSSGALDVTGVVEVTAVAVSVAVMASVRRDRSRSGVAFELASDFLPLAVFAVLLDVFLPAVSACSDARERVLHARL